MEDIYKDRFLSEGYPNLEKLSSENFTGHQGTADSYDRIGGLLRKINRLIDLSTGQRNILVIGCGPVPETVKHLIDLGYDAKGIEPVASFASSAAKYLDDPSRVINANVESIPLPNESQRIVLMENVIEHVDSPVKGLSEIYRILVNGGILYVSTNNKYYLSITGRNEEYTTRFFNWLPKLVKECYIFRHLHYEPTLAAYTTRPAVHWFSFADLCKLGRQTGFSQFYSPIDLLEEDSPSIQRTNFRKKLFKIYLRLRSNPWTRAILLLRFGGYIFMFKRMK